MLKKNRIALLLVLCLCVVGISTACGSTSIQSAQTGNLDNTILGTWTVTSVINDDGEHLSIADYCNSIGLDAKTLESSYTFGQDGKGTCSLWGGAIKEDLNYSIFGENVVINLGDSQSEMTYQPETGELLYTAPENGLTTILSKAANS